MSNSGQRVPWKEARAQAVITRAAPGWSLDYHGGAEDNEGDCLPTSSQSSHCCLISKTPLVIKEPFRLPSLATLACPGPTWGILFVCLLG